MTYASRDGKVSLDASGEAVHLPNGPAVIGEDFSLLIPRDLLELRAFRERNLSRTADTRAWLEGNPMGEPSDIAMQRLGELASALLRLRPGSRSLRVPKGYDGDEGWDE